jgi:hypothetical protein
MSVLERSVFFGGGENIESGDLSRSEVGNFSSDIDQALRTHYGWRNKAIGVIGLCLTPDNLRISSGTFITRGSLDLKVKRIDNLHIRPLYSLAKETLGNF